MVLTIHCFYVLLLLFPFIPACLYITLYFNVMFMSSHWSTFLLLVLISGIRINVILFYYYYISKAGWELFLKWNKHTVMVMEECVCLCRSVAHWCVLNGQRCGSMAQGKKILRTSDSWKYKNETRERQRGSERDRHREVEGDGQTVEFNDSRWAEWSAWQLKLNRNQ